LLLTAVKGKGIFLFLKIGSGTLDDSINVTKLQR